MKGTIFVLALFGLAIAAITTTTAHESDRTRAGVQVADINTGTGFSMISEADACQSALQYPSNLCFPRTITEKRCDCKQDNQGYWNCMAFVECN